MFEIAKEPLGERWSVNLNKYSCYFFTVPSYLVRRTVLCTETGNIGERHANLQIKFHSCKHPEELLQRTVSCKFAAYTGSQALLEEKKNSLEKYVFLKFGFEEKSDFCIFSKHGGSEGVGMERIRSTLEDLENFLCFVFPL